MAAAAAAENAPPTYVFTRPVTEPTNVKVVPHDIDINGKREYFKSYWKNQANLTRAFLVLPTVKNVPYEYKDTYVNDNDLYAVKQYTAMGETTRGNIHNTKSLDPQKSTNIGISQNEIDDIRVMSNLGETVKFHLQYPSVRRSKMNSLTKKAAVEAGENNRVPMGENPEEKYIREQVTKMRTSLQFIDDNIVDDKF